MSAGLVPILEPEVDIHSVDKADAQALLLDGLVRGSMRCHAGRW